MEAKAEYDKIRYSLPEVKEAIAIRSALPEVKERNRVTQRIRRATVQGQFDSFVRRVMNLADVTGAACGLAAFALERSSTIRRTRPIGTSRSAGARVNSSSLAVIAALRSAHPY